jgi:capsular polysaccharide biosynthesis protein
MDLHDVARRILLGHRIVMLACIVVSTAVVLAIHMGESPLYSASTRVILDFPEPSSAAQATAIAEAAKAIITSPTHIISALNAAGVTRDPLLVAQGITVVPLGTSEVVQITVQDSKPDGAMAIANALTDDLIQTRLAGNRSTLIPGLDDQIKSLDDRIGALDKQITSLSAQLQGMRVDPSDWQTAGVRGQLLSDQIIAASNQRAALTQEKLNLQAQRNSLILGSTRPTPTVVDWASLPLAPDPSRLLADIALALIGGLVLGVAGSAAMEQFGSRVAGRASVASAFGAPVLGRLPDTTGLLPRRLKLAANAAEIGAVELIGAGDTPDLSLLAKTLQAARPDQTGAKRVAIFSTEETPPRSRSGQTPSYGFVVVAPERLKRADLLPVKDLIEISGRPLLGVITHTPNHQAQAAKTKASPETARIHALNGQNGINREVLSDLWGVG